MLSIGGVQPTMKRPDEITLSQADGEALIERLEGDALTADDRRVLVKLITFHFWLLFALQEAKFGLKRLRAILFGEKPKKRQKQTSSSESSDCGGGAGGVGAASTEASVLTVEDNSPQGSAGGRRPGHGRQGAEAYGGGRSASCAAMRRWR
jgi:hypothetical protein